MSCNVASGLSVHFMAMRILQIYQGLDRENDAGYKFHP